MQKTVGANLHCIKKQNNLQNRITQEYDNMTMKTRVFKDTLLLSDIKLE